MSALSQFITEEDFNLPDLLAPGDAEPMMSFGFDDMVDVPLSRLVGRYVANVYNELRSAGEYDAAADLLAWFER